MANDMQEVFCFSCGLKKSLPRGLNTWSCFNCGNHEVIISYIIDSSKWVDQNSMTVYGTLTGKKFASISTDTAYERHFVGGYKLPSYIMLADMERDVVTLWNEQS